MCSQRSAVEMQHSQVMVEAWSTLKLPKKLVEVIAVTVESVGVTPPGCKSIAPLPASHAVALL